MAKKNFVAEVDGERRHREALEAELDRVEAAAASRAEREVMVDDYLSALSGGLDLRALGVFREGRTASLEFSSGGNSTSLVPLLTTLLRPKLRDLLLSYGDADAAARGLELSAAERKAKAAELTDSIYRSEVAEEILIRDAAAQGVKIRRRGGADPRAVLSRRPEPLAAA